jgi:hypothetical protein
MGIISYFHRNRKPIIMKKIAILLLVVTAFFSCSKTSTNPPSINISALPKSFTQYSAQNHLILYRIYKYDSFENLAGISLRQNDTVGGTVYVDSGSYYFNVNQSANLPTGYTYVYRKSSNTQAQVETHALYFNSGKQVIKDSGLAVISGDNPNAPTRYYYYTDNTVARTSWVRTGGTYNQFLIDSLYTASGDVGHYAQYANGGSGNNWVVSGQYWIGIYSPYANPFYDQGLSYSFGGFLLLEGIEDFLSKDLANDPGYTFSLDSKGRVVSGTAADGSYIQVTYQN